MVQTAVASGASSAYGPVQREAVVWADGEPSVAHLVAATSDQVWAAVKAANRSDPWWPAVRGHGLRPGMGEEVDAIAVDGHRLLDPTSLPSGGGTVAVTATSAVASIKLPVFVRTRVTAAGSGHRSTSRRPDLRLCLQVIGKPNVQR